MAANDAVKYLQNVGTNKAEREKLRAALGPDLVKAGKAAGYDFTEADLSEVLATFKAPADPGLGGVSVSASWS